MRLMKFEEGRLRADYFESLEEMHSGCLRRCKTLMDLLDVEETPVRQNASRQVSEECGFFVLHYLEHSVRLWAGEGQASVPWPDAQRIKALRKQLASLLNAMEKERLRWRKDALEEQALEARELDAAAASLRKWAKDQGRLKEVLAFVQEQALLQATHGASGKPPPPPEGFGVRPPRPPRASSGALEGSPATSSGATAAASGSADPPPSAASAVPIHEDTPTALEDEDRPSAVPILEEATPSALEDEDRPSMAASGDVAEALSLSTLEVTDWLDWARTITPLEVLEDRFQAQILKAMQGIGVCSKCRWKHGCLECDEKKAWRWALRKHWHAKTADLRPKAKGRPRAKPKAKLEAAA